MLPFKKDAPVEAAGEDRLRCSVCGYSPETTAHGVYTAYRNFYPGLPFAKMPYICDSCVDGEDRKLAEQTEKVSNAKFVAERIDYPEDLVSEVLDVAFEVTGSEQSLEFLPSAVPGRMKVSKCDLLYILGNLEDEGVDVSVYLDAIDSARMYKTRSRR